MKKLWLKSTDPLLRFLRRIHNKIIALAILRIDKPVKKCVVSPSSDVLQRGIPQIPFTLIHLHDAFVLRIFV